MKIFFNNLFRPIVLAIRSESQFIHRELSFLKSRQFETYQTFNYTIFAAWCVFDEVTTESKIYIAGIRADIAYPKP